MNSSFSLVKYDDINLKKYKIYFKDYKIKIKKLLSDMLAMQELRTSVIFSKKISKIYFDIAFCNDESIKQINKEYRFKDNATDVITFSLFADDKNSIIYRKTAVLGQIIISVETAEKQKQTTLEKEILTLTCHGILHLFGFDHLNKKDYDFVVSIQEKLLRNYE